MPNPISTSFITSAMPGNTGAPKADDTLSNTTDAPFSGLLNQALSQNQAPAPKQTDNTLKNNSMSVPHQTENQDKTEDNSLSAVVENAVPDASHPNQDSSNKKTDVTTETTDSNQQIDPQNLQALALSLQLQPIPLTTLPTASLFSQALSATMPAVNPGASTTENPQTTTNPATLLTSTTPNLPPIVPGMQNQLAFSLTQPIKAQIPINHENSQQTSTPLIPETEVAPQSIAQTLATPVPNPGNTTSQIADLANQPKQSTSVENTSPGNVSTAWNNHSPLFVENPLGLVANPVIPNQAPVNTLPSNQTGASGQNNLPITNNANAQTMVDQVTATPAPNLSDSHETTPLTSNAIAAGLQLQPNLNPVNPGNPKPNASAPSSTSFLNSLNNIQTTLKALNGKLETSSKSVSSNSSEDKKSDLTAEEVTTSATFNEPSDLFAATGLNGLPGTTSNSIDNSNSAIPTFTSTADTPVHQVAEGTVYSIKNGNKELIIRLNPDNLGEVRVNLTSHANQELSARLIASTPESHNLLKTQLDSLKNTLESQGITVDRLSVVLAGSPEASTNHHSHQQQFDQQQAPQQQQQQSTQQGSFQQQFNQQNPNSAALFNQMGNQSQNNFAQRFNNANNGTDPSTLTDNVSTTTPQTGNNDNGRISILA